MTPLCQGGPPDWLIYRQFSDAFGSFRMYLIWCLNRGRLHGPSMLGDSPVLVMCSSQLLSVLRKHLVIGQFPSLCFSLFYIGLF